MAPPIPAGDMATVSINLLYFPPIGLGHEPIMADVIFTDNYEDEDRGKSAKFRFVGA